MNQTDGNFEEMFEENSNEEKEPKPVMSRKTFFAILGAGTVLAVGAAAGYTFGIEPQLKQTSAVSAMDELARSHGPITGYNSSTVEFKGEGAAPSAENSNQLSLSADSTATNPAAFIFTNDKTVSSNIVDVYVDFSTQRSRDFINLNSDSLRGLVESGTIQLRIHPVPTDSKFSVYSAEALAESFEISPERSWSYLLEIMKMSAVLDESPTGNQEDEVLSAVVGSASKVGINGITAHTVRSGAFASWILSVGDDPKIQNQFGLPAIYTNDLLVDQDAVDINNSSALTKHLKGKESR